MLAAACAAGLFAASAASAESVRMPSRWIGQVDPLAGRFGWPGSGFELRFDGTRVEVILDDPGDNSLLVEVDGQSRRLDLDPGRKTYVLAEGLPKGEHMVRATRLTEGLFWHSTLVVAKSDGPFLPGTGPERHILVIGDSISTGSGVEGDSMDCPFTPETQNHALSYAAVAAKRFGAEVITLAATGKGLARNYDGTTDETMPKLMDRAVPTDAGVPVGPTARTDADAVVVHLGTNDFSGGHRPERFQADFAALLDRLRSRYPTAPIYLGIGPMLSGDDLAAAEDAVMAAADARRADGDTAVRFLSFVISQESFGCGWHPNVGSQARMADILAEAIAADLGWTAE